MSICSSEPTADSQLLNSTTFVKNMMLNFLFGWKPTLLWKTFCGSGQCLYGRLWCWLHEVACEVWWISLSSKEPEYTVACCFPCRKSSGELVPRAIFIDTTLETEPKRIVKAYNKRGNMENFIKETKLDFSMESASHSSFMQMPTQGLGLQPF